MICRRKSPQKPTTVTEPPRRLLETRVLQNSYSAASKTHTALQPLQPPTRRRRIISVLPIAPSHNLPRRPFISQLNSSQQYLKRKKSPVETSPYRRPQVLPPPPRDASEPPLPGPEGPPPHNPLGYTRSAHWHGCLIATLYVHGWRTGLAEDGLEAGRPWL